MGFRDDAEATRARIGTLEQRLEETQRALETARTELETERASRRDVPDALGEHRAEIQGLKARLRAAGVEREQLPRGRRLLRLMMVTIGFPFVFLLALRYTVGPVLVSVREEHEGALRELATCRDNMRRVAEGTAQGVPPETLFSSGRP